MHTRPSAPTQASGGAGQHGAQLTLISAVSKATEHRSSVSLRAALCRRSMLCSGSAVCALARSFSA